MKYYMAMAVVGIAVASHGQYLKVHCIEDKRQHAHLSWQFEAEDVLVYGAEYNIYNLLNEEWGS